MFVVQVGILAYGHIGVRSAKDILKDNVLLLDERVGDFRMHADDDAAVF